MYEYTTPEICYNFAYMKKDSPTYRALSNAFFSLISFGWPIIIAVFVTPFIVHRLGIKEYGVYLFISTLIGLAGLLDIGIASALGKFIAEEHGRENFEKLKKIFKIGNSIFLLIALVGSFGIVSTIFVGEFFFGARITEYLQYTPSFYAAAGMFFINSIMSIYVMLPNALQRVDAGVRVGLSFFTTQQIAIIVVLLCNGSINDIFISLLLLYVLFYFFYRRVAVRLVPQELQRALSMYGWDKKEVVSYYAFGLKVFVNNIANSSLTFLDKALMPIFIGPSNLTYYGIAGSIANKTPAISGTFANVIFPMAASFEGAGDRERTKQLYIRSMRLITILSLAIVITIISFPYKMLQYWISIDVAEHATEALIILTWTNFVLSLTGPLTNFLVGIGHLKVLTRTSVSAAVLNAILLVILLPLSGIYGASLAYLFALVPYIILFYWTETHFLMLTGRIRFYLYFALKLFFAGFVTFLFNQYVLVQYIYNFPSVLVVSAVSILFFMFVYYICGLFEKEDVRDIQHFARNILRIQKKAE